MKARRPFRKRPKRVGRGPGSGHGKTSGRGHKGQRARSGFHQRPGFEGGQNPLYRRLPKRGFRNANHKVYAIVNLGDLERCRDAEITPELLLRSGRIRKLGAGLKILGGGKLSRALTVKAHRFSSSAKESIEKAGGSAILLGGNEPDTSVKTAANSVERHSES